MGKNPASAKKQSSGADHSPKKQVNASTAKRGKKPVRVILFPTEPSTIGYDKIDEAVRKVIAARRKQ